MIEVRIPKEITEYKEKIIFGLSIRQIICFSIAIAMSLGTWFLVNPILGEDITSYIVIIEVLPCFAIGFIKINGFTFENYARLFIRHRLGKNLYTYKTETEFEYLDEIGKEEWKNANTKRQDETWEGVFNPKEGRKERLLHQKKEIEKAKAICRKRKSIISKKIAREEKKICFGTKSNKLSKVS